MAGLGLAMNLQPNNTLKSRFATSFLRCLIKINNISPPDSPGEIRRRRRRIKLAADYSIARAVRSPRAWKRAVLSRTTTRSRRARGLKSVAALRKYYREIKTKSKSSGEAAAELKELVTGGEGMKNLESLLEETTHYVKCLRTQVEVMTTILHLCTSTAST